MASLTAILHGPAGSPADPGAWSSSTGANSSASSGTGDAGTPVAGHTDSTFLSVVISGRSKSNANYWQWAGTWEDLGIPAGATVTNVSLSVDYRCSAYTTGAASTVGPEELRDSADALLGTFKAGTSFSATSLQWFFRGGTTLAVPAGQQASNSTIHLRLNDTLNTGASNSASVALRQAYVSVTITYTPAAQALNLGKAPTGAAVRGVDLAQSGPVALGLGKVSGSAQARGIGLGLVASTTMTLAKAASGAAVRGVALTASGPAALQLGKAPTSASARGVDITQSGPVAFALGSTPSSATARGIDLTASGPVTLGLGKVPGGATVHGVTLGAGGTLALQLGKAPSGATVRGITLVSGTPAALSLGKVTGGASVRGVGLTQSGPVTLGLGKAPSGAAVRGIGLGTSTLTLALGRVGSSSTARGVALAQSGPAVLALGRLASSSSARGVTFTLGALISWADSTVTASGSAALGASSSTVKLEDVPLGSVELADTPI